MMIENLTDDEVRVLVRALRWFRLWPSFVPNPSRRDEAMADFDALREVFPEQHTIWTSARSAGADRKTDEGGA